jgi:hypothetical protein
MSLVASMAHAADPNRLPTVSRVSIVSESPLELRIETTAPAIADAKIIEEPDRLVIDLPNTRPAPSLRRLNVNRGAVREVRTSLYSTKPPITRVVVDLTLPQWYRIVPDASGMRVTIGGGVGAPGDTGASIGWVSTKSAVLSAKATTTTAVHAPAAKFAKAAPVNGVSVEYENGTLTIHARNATLSEILFQIQKKTGAEIAIPAGTEQDRVAADFGPGSPSEVIGQLLNGSGLNFVVVGSEADPHILRSVILSRKEPDTGMPMQPEPPPMAQNVDNEAPQNMIAPGPEVEQQQQVQENPPPQDPPPTT